MASEQACNVTFFEQFDYELLFVDQDRETDHTGHDSFEISEYILVGNIEQEAAFPEYAPGPSIDIAWTPHYAPPPDARPSNPTRERSFTPTGLDAFGYNLWQAGPTQEIEPSDYNSLEFGYACAVALDPNADDWVVYPGVLPISARAATCYIPPENVSYGAQNYGVAVDEGVTHTEYQTDTKVGTPQTTEVAYTDQLAPSLFRIADPEAGIIQPPAPPISYRWNDYYSPDDLRGLFGGLPTNPLASQLTGQ